MTQYQVSWEIARTQREPVGTVGKHISILSQDRIFGVTPITYLGSNVGESAPAYIGR